MRKSGHFDGTIAFIEYLWLKVDMVLKVEPPEQCDTIPGNIF